MEVETPVEWMLRRREEMARCAAGASIVRHTIADLKLGMRSLCRMCTGPFTLSVDYPWSEKGTLKSKKMSVRKWITAAVLVLFVGAAPAKASAQKAVYLMNVCKEWSAWHSAQPTGTKTLHVTGICTFHTQGYHVELIKRKKQSCTLDLAITAPTGIGGTERGIRHIQVHYSEQMEQECDSVDIEPDGVTVPVTIIR